jgi:hypothetical protein
VAVPLGPPDDDTGLTRRRFVHRSIQEHLVAEHVAFRMTAGEAASELLTHLWYDPDWQYAAPAALAMHPERSQVLRALIGQAASAVQSAAVLFKSDDRWELRRFLARLARETREDDWPSQNCCGPIVSNYRCRSRSWHRSGDGVEFDRRSLSVEAGRCSVKQRVLGRTAAAMPKSRGANAEGKRLDRDS